MIILISAYNTYFRPDGLIATVFPGQEIDHEKF